MDPYLERRWMDIHTRLVAYASDQLNERLPPDLAATTEERIAIESSSDASARLAPDVSVVETGFRELVEIPGASPTASEEGSSVITAPYKLVVDLDPITERFIKIIGPDDEQTITVIEFISPTNKIGSGLEKFIRKREELLEAGVSVVEIDLVRRGDWRALLKPHICPREAISEYKTLESFANHTLLEFYPLTGRTHQIRLHCAFLGCPIVGDEVYGRKKPTVEINRHFLHAFRLKIVLLGEKEQRTFEAPLPGNCRAY